MDISPALLISASAKFQELTERETCEENLYAFLKAGWKYIDPAPFIGGWHLEAIAEHLQAVTDGHIKRLAINVPPRTSKSSLISVAYPAWIWAQSRIGPLSGPQVQFLSASYAHTLSLRDSVKMRRLVSSPWYQRYWGKRFAMTGDVNTKGRFENTKGGYRLATSVDGTTTGEGGDLILADDANSATEVESDLVRTSTNIWWDESMASRLNDPKTGAFIAVQQRLHQEDLTGHIITREGADWVWLMLPMEHDPSRHCITYVNGQKFWEDPRVEDGELLCPDRFGKTEIDNLSKRLGPFASAGQLQQSPVPRGGGIIKEEWWGQWIEEKYPNFEYVLASLDTAYTEKEENDPSALTLWGIYKDENNNPKIMLIHGWQDRLGLPDLVERVGATCSTRTLPDTSKYKYKPRFKVDKLIIESKASGISVYQELSRLWGFSGQFGIDLFNPTKLGDKQARVYSIQHLFSEGLIYIPWPKEKEGENKGKPSPYPYKWAEEIIDQITVFPRGSHDDFCFVAGTKIATKRGDVPIERIRVDEEVLTPAGWRKVSACGFTGIRPVISRFGITGTPDHPVFTVDSGYLELDTVTVGSQLSRLNLCDLLRLTLQKRLNSMALSTAGWVASDDTISPSHQQTPEEKSQKGFMWRFGNKNPVNRCRMATKSIMSMAIPLISCLKIWSAYRSLFIVGCLKNTAQSRLNILREFGRRLLNGISPQRGELGIVNMPSNLFTGPDTSVLPQRSKESELACGAGQPFHTKMSAPSFAVRNAASNIAAISAESTDLCTHSTLAPVFNLTVEGAHCYYANGILVHNCDSMSMALRYLRDTGLIQRTEEHAFDVKDEMMYRRRPAALYPV